jgi:hypothetical protein
LEKGINRMGLLSWLFGEGKKTPSIVKSNSGGTFSSYAVGHRHHQDALKRIFLDRTPENNEKLVEAVLVIDDANPYNSQAVRVDIQGQTVAYLKDENAKQFRKKMKEKGPSEIKATCAAKIVYWERESDNYLVILDLPLDYQPQPSYPAPSTATYEKEATGSEVLTLEISNLDPDELAEYHINDRVKLWMPPDDADKIFLYLGNWRLAFIAGKYFELVASHLNKKLPYDANVTELAAGRCRIKCKLISQEEAAILQKQERQKFEVEMTKKYTPKKGFEFSIELPKRHKLQEGQLLFLDKEPIENSSESPGEFGLKFVDEKNNVVAHKRWEKEKIKRILKARNSGYQLVIKIQSIDRPDKFTLEYISSIRATARIDFQKTNDLGNEKG